MKLLNNKIVLIAGAVVLVGFLARRAVGQAVQAVNPLNNQNVISEGFNEAIGLSGQDSSIGSAIFDWVQGVRGIAPYDPNAPLIDNGASNQ